MWYWLADIVVPLFTVGLGIRTKHKPPEQGKAIYRPKSAAKNQKTWDFASRKLGEFWFRVGVVLIVSVLLHRAFSKLDPMYITGINIAAALACLVAAFPVVDNALRRKFDEHGNEITEEQSQGSPRVH